MIYLDYFSFPNSDEEMDIIWNKQENRNDTGETVTTWGKQKTCYDSYYPFKILSAHQFERIDFEPVTIIYGGNGSGKSTALNVIAEKLNIPRDSVYNKSNFFPKYVELCEFSLKTDIPLNSRIITSDDVFDYMLNIRNLNQGIDLRRDELFQEYIENKDTTFEELRELNLYPNPIADYERLKKINKAKSKSQSQFVRSEMNDNLAEYSNGESAFIYFTEKIEENGLYILDEPENSLSPKRQMELADFILDSARFFNCQFIISTHSPFLLAIPHARIYDLDENPVDIKRWVALENVRVYRDFFKRHDNEF